MNFIKRQSNNSRANKKLGKQRDESRFSEKNHHYYDVKEIQVDDKPNMWVYSESEEKFFFVRSGDTLCDDDTIIAEDYLLELIKEAQKEYSEYLNEYLDDYPLITNLYTQYADVVKFLKLFRLPHNELVMKNVFVRCPTWDYTDEHFCDFFD